MSQSEYELFKPWLEKAGLKYDYEAVRLAMPDDSKIAGHYWAEVKLDTESEFDNQGWRIVDASNKKNNGIKMTMQRINSENSWEIVDWSKKDRKKILDELQARIDAGEDIGRQNKEGMSDMDTFQEGRDIYADDVEAGREEVYVGITDELGNPNRVANIDDFMQGKALAPYIKSCRDSCDFINGGDKCKKDCEKIDEKGAECYEECSGEKFYLVCGYICDEVSDSQWPNCYKECSGNTLSLSCDRKCFDD